MADPQFEPFKIFFDQMPQHIKAPVNCYRIAHDVDFAQTDEMNKTQAACSPPEQERRLPSPVADGADRDLVDAVNHACTMMNELSAGGHTERRRRRLPAIPANRKPLAKLTQQQPSSLADELRGADRDGPQQSSLPPESGPTKLIRQVSDRLYLEIDTSGAQPKSCLRLYDKSLLSGATNSGSLSPDDLRSRLSLDTGVDSGNSTAHSPDGAKSISPACNGSPLSASSPSSTTTSGAGLLQLQDATHRGLYRFVPRHADEVGIDIGDPVYVSKEADDAWCEGVNLRTGATGIFPSAYVIDADYSDFGSEGQQIRKERYLLDFLGSVEVSCHKGSEVFCQAIRKPNHVPTHDYFFNLKNVTFCGYHPKDHKYFGFITKHPLRERFACHVFQAEGSTREVAEAVGVPFLDIVLTCHCTRTAHYILWRDAVCGARRKSRLQVTETTCVLYATHPGHDANIGSVAGVSI
ncbi:JNK-interacting protein 1 isoform X2 [Dermacentor andersoni]|uniref:JNK-interacting protein 1 isoform X2 n=1 Tax=Dermacentor andersoni TaxID=34620 RepID=UPI0024180445|nr:JNK-interacting protein 1-like isoform X2 [Dermacentor andersoni]